MMRGCFPEKKSMYFHCFYHYGDNIQNVIYLDKLAKKLPEITIYYGITESQISQVQEFSSQKNLLIIPIDEIAFNSFDLWKNRYLYWNISPIKHSYYDFYMIFFNYISDKVNVINPLISKSDLLVSIACKPDKYQKFDILIVNSTPNSGQFKYSEKKLTKIITTLDENFQVITTSKISGINCTIDSGLTLKEIGELSLFCKIVVSISTGPSWAVLNKKNFDSKKPILILLDESEIVKFNSRSKSTSSLDHIIPFVNQFI